MAGQWTIIVDWIEGGEYEATAFISPDENNQLAWSSTDPHTLMAAIGRDLADHVQNEGN